jgi:hypothetical protein
MQKGEWTSARRRLAEANDVAQELQDDDLLEDLRRMRRAVDAAQDQSDAAAREESRAEEKHEEATKLIQQPAAVRAPPPLPPRPAPGQKVGIVSAHPEPDEGETLVASKPPAPVTPNPSHKDEDLYPLPPVGDMRGGQRSGAGVVGRKESRAAMHGPGRPSLSDNDGTGSLQQELEPTASPNADGSGHLRDPLLDVPNQIDGFIRVSMLESGRHMPSDNISHWTEISNAGQGRDLDMPDAEFTMEDVTGGLLGGAMHGLASLTDNSRRSDAFLLRANASLSQKDLTCIREFAKRAQQSRAYDPEGEDGLMVRMLLMEWHKFCGACVCQCHTSYLESMFAP